MTERHWVCNICGTRNDADAEICSGCGTLREEECSDILSDSYEE